VALIGIRSAKLKLVRAAKHLRAIKRCIALYSANKPHKIIRKSQGKKKVNIPKRPPQELRILIGEMVYQLRSALDHLVFELIKRNPDVATVDPDWEEHCQFPIRWRVPKNCTPPLAKGRFSGDLPGISDKAFAVIEGFQPYYASSATHTYLRLLAHLSNIDKHRHFNFVRPRVKRTEVIRFANGIVASGLQMLDRGAVIEAEEFPERDRPVYVKRRYSTSVAFDERRCLGDATALKIDFLLEEILKQIQTVVIPVFEVLLKKT
jgi:hypothetical protein